MELLDSTLPARILLAPGFLTLTIHDHIQGKRTWGGPFEKTLLSLILSAFLALLFVALNRISAADQITIHVFNNPLLSVIDALLLTVTSAFVLAALTHYDPLPSAFNRILRPGSKVAHENRRLWDRTFEKHHLKPATVTLLDGTVCWGYLDGYSTEDEPPLIRLGKARVLKEGQSESAPLPSSDLLLRGEFVKSVDVGDEAARATLHDAPRDRRWVFGVVIAMMLIGRVAYALAMS